MINEKNGGTTHTDHNDNITINNNNYYYYNYNTESLP